MCLLQISMLRHVVAVSRDKEVGWTSLTGNTNIYGSMYFLSPVTFSLVIFIVLLKLT